MRKKAEEDAANVDADHVEDVAPPLGNSLSIGTLNVSDHSFAGKHDTTVKVKFTLSIHPELAERSALFSLISKFGAVDESTIVFSVKPSKKAPQKPAKFGTAIVEFKQIRDAFGAVCASNRKDRGMEGVEVTWVAGKEPPILGWLRGQGMLGGSETTKATSSSTNATPSSGDLLAALNAKIAKSKPQASFSSFPESFVSRAFLSVRCI